MPYQASGCYHGDTGGNAEKEGLLTLSPPFPTE